MGTPPPPQTISPSQGSGDESNLDGVTLAPFAQLANALSRALTSRETALAVLEAADTLIGWDSCNLNIYLEGARQTQQVVCFDEINGERTEIPPADNLLSPSPMAQRVLNEGAILLQHQDIMSSRASVPMNSFGSMRDSASLLYVPIRRGDQNVGVLTIQSYSPGKYSEEDLSTLQVLADFAGVSIGKSLAEADLHRQIGLVEKFSRLGGKLATARNPRDVGMAILDAARNVVDWEAAFFYLFNEETEKIFGGVSFDTIDGQTKECEALYEMVSPGPLMKRSIEEGGFIHRAAESTAEEMAARDSFGDLNRATEEFIFLPVKYGGRTLAMFSFQTYQKGFFNEEHLKLAERLTQFGAGALARSFAEQQVREVAQRLELVTSQLPAILWTVDSNLRITMLRGGALIKLHIAADSFVGQELPYMLMSSTTSSESSGQDENTGVISAHRAALNGHSGTYELAWHHHVLSGYVEPLRDEEGNIIGCLNVCHDITTRKRMEEETEKYKMAIQYAPTSVVITDSREKIEYVNETFLRQTGFAPPEVLGKPLSFIRPPKEAIFKFMQENELLTEESFSHIRFCRRRDGSIYCEEPVKASLRNARGSVTHHVRIATDITEKLRAEVALKHAHSDLERRVGERTSELSASNKKLRAEVTERRSAEERLARALSLQSATLDSTFDAIVALDNRGYPLAWNSRCSEMWGLPVYNGERSNTSFYIFLMKRMAHPDRFASLIADINVAPNQENMEVVEHVDGRVFESYSKPQLIGGKTVGRVWSFRDITKRKRAEEALKYSERMYRETIERASGVPYRMFYGQEDYDFIGRGAEELLGIPLNEVSKQRIADLKIDIQILDMSAPEDIDTYDKWMRAGKVDQFRVDLHIRRPDGEERWINDTSVPFHDEETGEVIGTLGILQDITERKRFEEQLRTQTEQMAHAEKLMSLGTLVSGVGHEINNPNNFIQLNAPLFGEIWEAITPILDQYYQEEGDFLAAGMRYEELREEVPALVRGVLEGSKRIESIVAELKNLARPSEVGFWEVVSLNDVVSSALVLLNNDIKKSTQKFVSEFTKPLPSMRGNYQRIEQVVINLIQNACQALPDDQHGIRVETWVNQPEKLVGITVTDEGTGISKEALSRINDPFYTTKREEGGLGLGLSICSNIVNRHKGRLLFESDEGEGTRAILEFPMSPTE